MKLYPNIIPLTNINFKWIKDLNIRPDTIKILSEENHWEEAHERVLVRMLFGYNIKNTNNKRKINKWNFKQKSFCTIEEIKYKYDL